MLAEKPGSMGGAIAVHLSVDPRLAAHVTAMIVIDVVEGLQHFLVPICLMLNPCVCRISHGCALGNGLVSAVAAVHIQIGAGADD